MICDKTDKKKASVDNNKDAGTNNPGHWYQDANMWFGSHWLNTNGYQALELVQYPIMYHS
jgi:hypothetical protein